MNTNHVNVRFEVVDEGETYGVHIEERLHMEMQHGLWKATNPDGHTSWVGYGRSKHEAILHYLNRRLGLSVPRHLEEVDLPPMGDEAPEQK